VIILIHPCCVETAIAEGANVVPCVLLVIVQCRHKEPVSHVKNATTGGADVASGIGLGVGCLDDKAIGMAGHVCNSPAGQLKDVNHPGILAGQLLLECVAHQGPNLRNGILSGNLPANIGVEVLRRCAGRFASHRESVLQNHDAEGQEIKSLGTRQRRRVKRLSIHTIPRCEIPLAANVRVNVGWGNTRSGQPLGDDFLFNCVVRHLVSFLHLNTNHHVTINYEFPHSITNSQVSRYVVG